MANDEASQQNISKSQRVHVTNGFINLSILIHFRIKRNSFQQSSACLFFYSYHRNNSIYFAFDIPVAPDDSVNSSSSEFTASFEYTVPTKLPITLHFVFLFLFSSCCCRVAAAAAWDYLCMHLFKFNSDRR
jgi:hypothetical protein